MEWTVSAAKGVRKLSLRCNVICTWTWSQAVTSRYIKESSNGVECQPVWLFCRHGATQLISPRAHFHGSQINHITCWTSLTVWLTLTNETKPAVSVWNNMTKEWEYIVTIGLFENTKAQSCFPFSPLHCATITTQRKWKEEEDMETLCLSSLQELYLHWVQHSGSLVDKYSHILIFQLAWLLFSKHMQTQRGVY